MIRCTNNLFFIACLFPLSVLSFPFQKNDSLKEEKIDSTRIKYFVKTIDSLTLDKLHYTDTSITGFQQYDPAWKLNHFCAELGNIGLPYNSTIYKPNLTTVFYLKKNTSNAYLYKNDRIKYYRPLSPYTKLHYANGAKKEQFFRGIHSQNIFRTFTFGIDFRFIHSPGYYKQQKADDKNLVIKGQYYTKNKRYGVIANYVHNKNIVEENGGIVSDRVFENNLETDRQLYETNLSDAKNEIKHGSVYLNQYFYLSKAHRNDTADSLKINRKFHLGKLTHSFLWTRDQYAYIDNNPLSDFYSNYDPPLDSNKTFDTTSFTMYENELHWSNLGPDDKPADKHVYVHFGIKHQLIKFGIDTTQKELQQLVPSGGFSIFLFNSFRLNFDLDLVFGEYNGGDYNAHASVNQYLGNRERNLGLLKIDVRYVKKMPAWFYQRYISNHFRWDNNFSRQEYIIGNFAYQFKNLHVGANINQIRNYVYLDKNAHPKQYGESFSVFQVFVKKPFRFGKFGIDDYVALQKSTNEDILRLPEISAHLSIHFTTGLFKSATTIQPGIEVFYNTGYYGDAYMPALRSFYLQDETKVGNYIIADVFLNAKVKRALFFLKYYHFNNGWLGYNYFAVPHYPLQDAALKFGISWRFYD